jgi:hypothetical protein
MKSQKKCTQLLATGLFMLVAITPVTGRYYPCESPSGKCAKVGVDPCTYTLLPGTKTSSTKSGCIDCNDPDIKHHITTWTEEKTICETVCPDDYHGTQTNYFDIFTSSDLHHYGCCRHCY